MFPIRDARGRVIAFGGRILGDGEPKYLNSPDTPLFDKGRTLYNLDRAGPASRTAKRLIVVEGYMDVIALDRAGIAEAVAPNGTALTEAQLERHVAARSLADPLLRRRRRRAEGRGPRRAARAAPHRPRPHACASSSCPPARTPTMSCAAGGREAFEALLAEPEPLDERLWRHELEAEPLTTPEARAGLKPAAASTMPRPSATRRSRASTARNGCKRFDELRRPRRRPHQR